MAQPRRDRFGLLNPHGHYILRAGRLVRAPRKDRASSLPWVTPEGRVERIPVRTPAEKKALSQYWNAVKEFAETGNDRKLRSLRRKTFVDAQGRRRRFNLNREMLRQLGSRGRLAFDDFYP